MADSTRLSASPPDTPAVSRRRLIGWLGAALSVPVLAACGAGDAAAKTWPLNLTDSEWRKRLTPAQFHIMREKGTEYPGSSPLLHEQRKGTFVCAADGNSLFSSATKYDSRTGWPSFWQPLPRGITTATDWSGGTPRTEVLCNRCGGHLGHVFGDGPKPTGKRYCMNGAALAFRAG